MSSLMTSPSSSGPCVCVVVEPTEEALTVCVWPLLGDSLLLHGYVSLSQVLVDANGQEWKRGQRLGFYH